MSLYRRWLVCALWVSGSCLGASSATAFQQPGQQFSPGQNQPPARPTAPTRPSGPNYVQPPANTGAPTTAAPPQYGPQPPAQYGPQPGVQQPAGPPVAPQGPQVPFQLTAQQQADV